MILVFSAADYAVSVRVVRHSLSLNPSPSFPPRLIAIRQTGRRRRQRPGFLRARCLQREEVEATGEGCESCRRRTALATQASLRCTLLPS